MELHGWWTWLSIYEYSYPDSGTGPGTVLSTSTATCVLQVQKEHLAASGALLVSGAHTSGAHGDDGVGRIADLLRVRGDVQEGDACATRPPSIVCTSHGTSLVDTRRRSRPT